MCVPRSCVFVESLTRTRINFDWLGENSGWTHLWRAAANALERPAVAGMSGRAVVRRTGNRGFSIGAKILPPSTRVEPNQPRDVQVFHFECSTNRVRPICLNLPNKSRTSSRVSNPLS